MQKNCKTGNTPKLGSIIVWQKGASLKDCDGAVFTAEQWKGKYPVARLDNIVVICSQGEINGGFFGTLGQMESLYAQQGCDFTNAATAEAKLEAIEAFEDAMNAPSDENTAEERIAAALELQNIMAMETVNTDDSDVEYEIIICVTKELRKIGVMAF